MLKNYLKIAWRNLWKQKGYASINIFGLAIGLTCFLLIILFVRFELSYDTFHKKADRIYRIAKEDPGNYYFGSNQFAITPAPLASTLMEAFPEVEYATQIEWLNLLLEHGEKRFYENGIYATEHFFHVFSFSLLQGNPHTALKAPNSIILTESLARKYFGDADPVGQSLSVGYSNRKVPMKITGVVADAPANSHFSFDYLIAMSSSEAYARNLGQWDDNNYFTYAALRPGYSLPVFKTKLAALPQQYLRQYDHYQKHPEEISTFFPQALTDIHLHSHVNFEFGVNGDIKYVYMFSVIGLLILLIACINYMNLVTARSALRAREVGVRKAMGAGRLQLVKQFLGESIIPAVLATLLAIVLMKLLLPVFNMLTQRQLILDITRDTGILAILLLIGFCVGVLAGSYPAFVMSAFQPVTVIKSGLQRNHGNATLRNLLVVVQFTITVPLIIATIVVQKQLHYIHSSDTGINRDHIISIPVRDRTATERFAVLKQNLLQHPNVLGVTASLQPPTRIAQQSDIREWEGAAEGQQVSAYNMGVEHDFIDMMGIKLVEGRNFSTSFTTDEGEAMLINETLARQLGWKTAVGKWFHLNGRKGRIAGVMKDFNFQSFHEKIAPLALFVDPRHYATLLVKVRPEEMQKTIAFLEKTMTGFSPGYPFDYQFLDDAYDRMYQTETRLGSLFSYFTTVALVIACLGLLGLAAFTASQRTKEIGIRKVMGASVTSIVAMLSKDYLKQVFIGFLIAVPIAWWAMNNWLKDFAYRIEVQWWMFALAGLLAVVISLLTVSFQSVKAALTNPVKSLRSE
jgi:putative ABC transport system permease protein